MYPTNKYEESEQWFRGIPIVHDLSSNFSLHQLLSMDVNFGSFWILLSWAKGVGSRNCVNSVAETGINFRHFQNRIQKCENRHENSSAMWTTRSWSIILRIYTGEPIRSEELLLLSMKRSALMSLVKKLFAWTRRGASKSCSLLHLESLKFSPTIYYLRPRPHKLSNNYYSQFVSRIIKRMIVTSCVWPCLYARATNVRNEPRRYRLLALRWIELASQFPQQSLEISELFRGMPELTHEHDVARLG